MKYNLILIAVFLFFQNSNGQTFRAFSKAGHEAYLEENYSASMEYYRKAIALKGKKIDTKYKFAEAARKFNAFEMAKSNYLMVLEHPKKDNFPLLKLRLGQICRNMGDYDLAIGYFKDFIKGDKSDKVNLEKAKEQIKYCQWSKELVNTPDSVEITQLDKKINSPFSEFGAMVSGDTLYYSSFRYKTKKQPKNKSAQYFTKVLTSIKGAKGRPMRKKFNAENKHTAHSSFSLDGRKMYFTECEYVNDVKIRCGIFYKDKDKRGRWNKPVDLGQEINLAGYTSTQPNIGIEPSSGEETLYFSSDRPGGAGGLDIWKVNLVDGLFKVVNIIAINTPENEISPFYEPAAQQLYFSSDGLQGLGGYDIYKVIWQNSRKDWSVAIHLGYPINSSYNDIYFSKTKDPKVGYFSSNRLGSFYLDKNNKACCNDIYRATFVGDEAGLTTNEELVTTTPPKDLPTLPVEKEIIIPPIDLPQNIVKTKVQIVVEKVPDNAPPVVETKVETKHSKGKELIFNNPRPTPIVPSKKTLTSFLPVQLYFHNDEPNPRSNSSSTDLNYKFCFDNYYKLKENYQRNYSALYKGEERTNANYKLANFFDNKVKQGFEDLELFTRTLISDLQSGANIELTIKGFTSPRAQNLYNVNLGKRRVDSVKNYLMEFEAGKLRPYFQNGQLQMVETSYGENLSPTGISDSISDRRNSIYSVEASQERRVEIIKVRK